jgi:hypothetical protein
MARRPLFSSGLYDRRGAWRSLVAGSDPGGRKDIPQADLAQACSRADIVIARQALDPSCRPAQLRADGALLERSGGLSLDLRHGTIPMWRISRAITPGGGRITRPDPPCDQ